MNIGIIGAGTVGGTLGRAWARRGHQILYGVRDPSEGRVRELGEKLGADAKVGTVAGAAAFGQVILLATPWSGTEQALRSAGNLSGKIVLDATNPLKADLSGLPLGHTTSGGEQGAHRAAGAPRGGRGPGWPPTSASSPWMRVPWPRRGHWSPSRCCGSAWPTSKSRGPT